MTEAEVSEAPGVLEATPTPARKGPGGLLVAVGVVVAGLALLCVVAAIILVVLDPWGWIDRFLGRGAGAAAVTPPDVPLYIGADLAGLRSDEVDRLIATFAEASGSEYRDLDGLLETLDDDLEDEIGMTVSDDVLPWIGPYAGLSLFGFESETHPSAGFSNTEWLLAVMARDRGAADDFLAQLRENLAERSEGEFVETEHRGVAVYELEGSQFERWAVARSGAYALMGSSLEAIRAAIDAQRGQSLADLDVFRTSVGRLPRGRIVTAFVNYEAMGQMMQDLGGIGGIQGFATQSGGATSGAVSVSLVEEGVRASAVTTIDPESLTAAQRESFESPPASISVDGRFPANTLLLVASRGLDEGWEAIEERAQDDEALADFVESLELLEAQIGIDLITDLFPYLDGEVALGVIPERGGLLSLTTNLPISLLVLAETSDEGSLRETVEQFTEHMRETSGQIISETTIEGIGGYEVLTPFFEEPQLVYGVGEGILFIASGTEAAESAFAGGPDLAQDELYRSTWEAFPQNQIPTLYVNLRGLLDQIREAQSGMGLEGFDESTAFLEPIRVVAAAGGTSADLTSETTIIVFVEWSEADE